MCDGNLYALNEHIGDLEQQEARSDYLTEKATEIFDCLKNGSGFKIGRYTYDFDDALNDCEELTGKLKALLVDGDNKKFTTWLNDEVYKFCEKLAEEVLQNEN